MSLRLAVLNTALRLIAKPLLARAANPVAARRRFARVARGFRMPPFAMHLEGPLHRVTVRPSSDDRVILYFHGGAYVTGSPQTHLALAARLARLSGLAVYLPDYPLAPEHPAPAAFDHAVLAFSRLRAKGYAPGRIILGGDSAGAGLALALLSHLCVTGQRPAGYFGFSPWTDLALTGSSLVSNARSEALLPAARLAEAVKVICGDLSPRDPRISPLHGDFPNPCAVFLQVGSTEILRDDTLRMAEVLRSAGGEVVVQVWPDCPHVWQIFDGYVPEARQALKQVAAFISGLSVLPPPTGDS